MVVVVDYLPHWGGSQLQAQWLPALCGGIWQQGCSQVSTVNGEAVA